MLHKRTLKGLLGFARNGRRIVALIPGLMLFGLIALQPASLHAQSDHNLLISSQHNAASASVLPGQLGMNLEDGTALILPFLPNLHVQAGSDLLRWSDIKTISRQNGDIDNTTVDGFVEGLPEAVRTDFSTRFDVFAVFIPVRKRVRSGSYRSSSASGETQNESTAERIAQGSYTPPKKTLFTFGLRWSERAMVHSALPKNLFRLAWDGNAPYAGENLEMLPLGGQALAWREWAFSVSVPVYQRPDFTVQVGANAKWLAGYGMAEWETQRASLYTDPLGLSIEADVASELRYAGWMLEQPSNVGDVLRGAGQGWGLDVGASARLWERWSIDAAFIDFGRINFDAPGERIRAQGNYAFEGLVLEGETLDIDLEETLDSIAASFELDTLEYASPSVRLPHQMVFRVGYGVPTSNRRGRPYMRHQAYLHGILGPERGAFPGTREIGISYLFNAGSIWEIGTTMAYRNGDAIWSLQTGVRFGPFRWALASQSLGSFVLPGVRSQADLSTRMAFVF